MTADEPEIHVPITPEEEEKEVTESFDASLIRTLPGVIESLLKSIDPDAPTGRMSATLSVATTLRSILDILQEILTKIKAIENEIERKKELESGIRVDRSIFPFEELEEMDAHEEKLKNNPDYFKALVSNKYNNLFIR